MNAISRAAQTNSASMWRLRLHPTIRREEQSRTTARYSQPSTRRMYVMSASHFVADLSR